MFHKNNKNVGTTNFLDSKHKTITQRFIQIYKTVEAQYDGTASDSQIYQEAIDLLKRDQESRKAEDEISLSSAFKEAQAQESRDKVKINVSDIFKE